VRTVRVAVQGEEVVPGEQDVGAELLGLRARPTDVGVLGVLRLQLDADADRAVCGQGVTS
jgi:hypothetical protein